MGLRKNPKGIMDSVEILVDFQDYNTGTPLYIFISYPNSSFEQEITTRQIEEHTNATL